MDFEYVERCPTNTALDYGSTPQRDTSFNSSMEQVIDCGINLPRPMDNMTLKFPIGESKQYIDGLQASLHLQLQIRNKDGSLLTEDKEMAPVCGIGGAMVNKMSIWTGGRPWKVYNMFSYMYHVLNLLHHSPGWFKTLGTASGFIPDTITADPVGTWEANTGLIKRREWANKSKVFEVVDRLMCPVWLQER